MTTYAISAPDGQTYQIDGPPGATDDQVRAEVLRQHPTAGTKPTLNGWLDIAKGYGTGLSKGIAGLADTVMAASPLGAVAHAVSIAANPLSTNLQGPTANLFGQNATPHFKAQTTAGQVAETAGMMTPAAAAPGNVFSRAANVIVPTVTTELAGRTAHAFGASPQVEQLARTAGAVAGGALASARLTPRATPGTDEAVANVFANRANADPQAMAAKAADLRASGVEPTVIDVTGTPGQRLTKAVGITNDQAGETLQNNANTVTADTKPAVMARTRTLAGDSRTADQLAKDMDTARTTEARTTYATPYSAPVELKDPNVIQALRDPEGLGAINRAITAARARMDYKAVADLQALKATASGPTGDGQVWPTTGAALDRVQIAFGNKGRALAQNGATDIASGMFKRQELINGALDNVEGLQPARAAFRAKSQAIDILTKPGARLDPFSTDPADYKAWADSLPPEAQHANQVAIRQDVLDWLGGQRASSMGSIDDLTSSQYAKQNLATALGQKESGDYLANLMARLAQKRNATQVSPYAGSPTKMLQNDTSGLDRMVDLADTAVKVKTGNLMGLAAKLSAHLKTAGLSDETARALARAATDPTKLDAVIAAISRAKGPQAARSFVNFRGGLIGAARGAGQARTLQPQAPQ